MTCREKLAIEHPDRIHSGFGGGCYGCPHHYDYMDRPLYCNGEHIATTSQCVKCWDRVIPGTEKKEEPVTDERIDIHKIIDDAMEKKDRIVSIYIGHSGVTINVQPYEMEVPHWINHDTDVLHCMHECSACGHANDWPANYCPHCGEQMKIIRDQKEEETDGQI